MNKETPGQRTFSEVSACDNRRAASTANEAAGERRKTLTRPGRPDLWRVIDR